MFMKKSHETWSVWSVLILVGLAMFVVAVVTVVLLGLSGSISITDYENRIAYKTEYYEKQQKVKVENISKEKGKEAIYTISTFSGEAEIPESIYLEYIGDENNTITLRVEELSIYVATSMFGLSFDESEIRCLERISYPWEDCPQKFSDEEIDEVVKAIKGTVQPEDLLSGNTYSEWRELSFSFEYNNQSWGVHTNNCLEEGAIRYREKGE